MIVAWTALKRVREPETGVKKPGSPKFGVRETREPEIRRSGALFSAI